MLFPASGRWGNVSGEAGEVNTRAVESYQAWERVVVPELSASPFSMYRWGSELTEPGPAAQVWEREKALR